MHGTSQSGISSNKESEGALSIVLNLNEGLYPDNRYMGNILYTYFYGIYLLTNLSSSRYYEGQKTGPKMNVAGPTRGNLALHKSIATKQAVRVVLGYHDALGEKEYCYLGLYTVTKAWPKGSTEDSSTPDSTELLDCMFKLEVKIRILIISGN